MRPPGEIRRALRDAAQALARERPRGWTWRDLAQRGCVGLAVARHTVLNMARAGELGAVGSVAVPGSRRPMTTYAPLQREATGPAALDALMRTWSR